MKVTLTLLLLALAPQVTVGADISRIWLTHKSSDPSKIVVNWMTDEPGDSVVRFGLSSDYGETVRIEEDTTLHHVEIPLKHRDTVYHYSVSSGDQQSEDAAFKAYPTDVLRAAVVADWQGKPDLSAIMEGDVPGDEWKWRFDLPEFDLRFVGLNFNHISDFGTTWQTCHAFDEDSEQFRWYEKLMEEPPGFVVTLYNERNSNIRNQAGGKWHDPFRRGTCCITGFGYFAERAEVDGFPYYNIALNGRGNQYPDPQSKFLAGEDSYLLLTVEEEGQMAVEIKRLNGAVLDRWEYLQNEARWPGYQRWLALNQARIELNFRGVLRSASAQPTPGPRCGRRCS